VFLRLSNAGKRWGRVFASDWSLAYDGALHEEGVREFDLSVGNYLSSAGLAQCQFPLTDASARCGWRGFPMFLRDHPRSGCGVYPLVVKKSDARSVNCRCNE